MTTVSVADNPRRCRSIIRNNLPRPNGATYEGSQDPASRRLHLGLGHSGNVQLSPQRIQSQERQLPLLATTILDSQKLLHFPGVV